MEKIQMTQIGIDNYLLYTKNEEKELCKICQTYPNSNYVDIICIEDEKRVGKVDYTICLKPIKATQEIIEVIGFSIVKRQNEPKKYGYPANEVFDIVYKHEMSRMVVKIYDFYYLLFNDTRIICRADFPLCVHHLQNMITNVGGDIVEKEMSLISLLKDKVSKESNL